MKNFLQDWFYINFEHFVQDVCQNVHCLFKILLRY